MGHRWSKWISRGLTPEGYDCSAPGLSLLIPGPCQVNSADTSPTVTEEETSATMPSLLWQIEALNLGAKINLFLLVIIPSVAVIGRQMWWYPARCLGWRFWISLPVHQYFFFCLQPPNSFNLLLEYLYFTVKVRFLWFKNTVFIWLCIGRSCFIVNYSFLVFYSFSYMTLIISIPVWSLADTNQNLTFSMSTSS